MLSGTLHTLVVESAVLRDNPLGDPAVRELPAYLPPGGAEGRDLPLVAVLAGFAGNGAGNLRGTPWDLSFPERYERLLDRDEVAPAAFIFPDCWTRFGGSQYLNSSATGRYMDHLVDEVFPFAEGALGVGGRRERRGLMGKSSGGFGALNVALQRPESFAALASHAGDACFEMSHKPDFPKLLGMLDEHGDLEGFLDAFESASRKTTPLVLAMNVVAMAAAYSPRAGAPLGLELPFEPRTGRLRPEVWARWTAHDPVDVVPRLGQRLADYRLVYLDAGRRDEFHLQYGARQVADALRVAGVRVHHEEFDDGHMGISYRYETSLPLLTHALARPA